MNFFYFQSIFFLYSYFLLEFININSSFSYFIKLKKKKEESIFIEK
jgi:hypothetical protein